MVLGTKLDIISNRSIFLVLTITLETTRVTTQPGGLVGSTNTTVGAVSLLAESTSLSTSRGQSTHLTVLVNRVYDPVDAWIVANLWMGRIDQNDFVIFHGCILVDPVGVQDTQVGITTSNLFFRNTLQVALKLQVVDTLMLGLTKDHTWFDKQITKRLRLEVAVAIGRK